MHCIMGTWPIFCISRPIVPKRILLRRTYRRSHAGRNLASIEGPVPGHRANKARSGPRKVRFPLGNVRRRYVPTAPTKALALLRALRRIELYLVFSLIYFWITMRDYYFRCFRPNDRNTRICCKKSGIKIFTLLLFLIFSTLRFSLFIKVKINSIFY